MRATNPINAKLRVIDHRSGQLFRWLRGEDPIASLGFEGVRSGVGRVVTDNGPTIDAEVVEASSPRDA